MRIWERRKITCLGLSVGRGSEQWLGLQALEADAWAHKLALLFPTFVTSSRLLEFLVYWCFHLYNENNYCVFL